MATAATGLAPVLGIIGVAPPWPGGLSILTAFAVLVFLVFSVQFQRGSIPSGRFRQIGLLLGLAALGVAYSVLFERFTFELPTTGGRIALGCGFTPEAVDVARNSLIDTAGDCPGHFEELLEKTQYEAHFVWTKRSIATVRLALAALWSLWFACFSVLALTGMKRTFQPLPDHGETHGRPDFDVFVSYAREDRARVEMLVRSLEAEGFTIWWDHDLTPGQTWDAVLEERLATARCVLVVWSGISVAKRWVREEASRAADRLVLVPARIDDVEPPFGFTRFHTASLVDWNGESATSEFRSLVDGIAALVRPARQDN